MKNLLGNRAILTGLVTTCLVASTVGVALSHVIKPQPAAALQGPVEPASPAGFSAPARGCWEVSIHHDIELAASWSSSCPDTPPVMEGAREWPTRTLRLPALSSGELPMAKAQTHVMLSEELAMRGTGALLFLPANTDGSGYYVAAWTTQSPAVPAGAAPQPVKRGLQVGLYSVPPTSVATPAGRVYLSAEVIPATARHHMAKTVVVPESTTDETSDDVSDSENPES